jgi:hypothetical protein
MPTTKTTTIKNGTKTVTESIERDGEDKVLTRTVLISDNWGEREKTYKVRITKGENEAGDWPVTKNPRLGYSDSKRYSSERKALAVVERHALSESFFYDNAVEWTVIYDSSDYGGTDDRPRKPGWGAYWG